MRPRLNEQGGEWCGSQTASNASQGQGTGQRTETASQRGPPRLDVKGTIGGGGRTDLRGESAGANTQRRNQTQSRDSRAWLASQGWQGNEGRRGRHRSPAVEGRPEAFPGRAWKTRARRPAAVSVLTREGLPSVRLLSPRRPLSSGTSAAHRRVSQRRGGWAPGTHRRRLLGSTTDTPPEGGRTHVSPGRAGKASDLQPSPFLCREAGTERGRNLPRASSKSAARRRDWPQLFLHYSTS